MWFVFQLDCVEDVSCSGNGLDKGAWLVCPGSSDKGKSWEEDWRGPGVFQRCRSFLLVSCCISALVRDGRNEHRAPSVPEGSALFGLCWVRNILELVHNTKMQKILQEHAYF